MDSGHTIQAHRSVLSLRCPDLLDIVDDADSLDGNNKANVIEIERTNADLFATLIQCAYPEKLPMDFNLEKDGKDLLKLADRFGYTKLKMNIEADFVESKLLTAENAIGFLFFADAHSCALLKEAAQGILLASDKTIPKREDWAALKEAGLHIELFEQLFTDDGVPVSELRKMCFDRGLEVDGTKEMLINRLAEEVDDSEDEEEEEVDFNEIEELDE